MLAQRRRNSVGVSLVARDQGVPHCARVSGTNLGYSGDVCGISRGSGGTTRGSGMARAAGWAPRPHRPAYRDTSESGEHMDPAVRLWGRAHIVHPGRTVPRRTLPRQSRRPGWRLLAQWLLSASCGVLPTGQPRPWEASSMGILSNEQREPNQEKPANRAGGTLSQTLTWSHSSLRCVRQELALSGPNR